MLSQKAAQHGSVSLPGSSRGKWEPVKGEELLSALALAAMWANPRTRARASSPVVSSDDTMWYHYHLEVSNDQTYKQITLSHIFLLYYYYYCYYYYYYFILCQHRGRALQFGLRAAPWPRSPLHRRALWVRWIHQVSPQDIPHQRKDTAQTAACKTPPLVSVGVWVCVHGGKGISARIETVTFSVVWWFLFECTYEMRCECVWGYSLSLTTSCFLSCCLFTFPHGSRGAVEDEEDANIYLVQITSRHLILLFQSAFVSTGSSYIPSEEVMGSRDLLTAPGVRFVSHTHTLWCRRVYSSDLIKALMLFICFVVCSARAFAVVYFWLGVAWYSITSGMSLLDVSVLSR